ncbi:DUF2783 domain-containing protein [Achromobacter pulmonis]|uniref:DUF2783 domain-containing protein n=1 Tax=Achromobacter pulmonis TaxID=1389932 RepID=A0A2N8KP53_9BURK|nr:DUF2783 domain-containing protein [Achromobacter pulmonis]PND35210.1 DUF2783 domain-containing protein [Achromobacter pulmonis]
MSLSQQQLDDLLERLVALTDVPDPVAQRDRLARLSLCLIEALDDGPRAQAILDKTLADHPDSPALTLP